MGGHVVVDFLSVFLFFLLNVVQNIARLLTDEFEDARIVERGNMFLGVERIAAKVLVLFTGFRLLLRSAGTGGRILLLLGAALGIHGGNRPALHLFERFQMFFFGRLDAFKQRAKLLISRAVRIVCVLIDADLFGVHHVLQKH